MNKYYQTIKISATMKTRNFKPILSAFFLLLFPLLLSAQSLQTGPFTGVEAGGVFSVSLYQGDTFDVVIDADEAIMTDISARVRNGILTLEYTGNARNLDRILAHITAPQFLMLKGMGVSSFKGETTLHSPSLKIEGGGASNFNLDINTDMLSTQLTGASNATLSGRATVHQLKVSGASLAKAFDLETETTEVNISGASNARVAATTLLSGEVSGTSSLSVKEKPVSQSINLSGLATIVDAENQVVSESRSTSDTVRVRVGSREVTVVDGKTVTTRRTPARRSFRKNWTGLELGINGYMTPDNNLNLPAGQEYLDLRYEKSVAVNLNIYQQHLSLIGNQVGLYTGLGIGWNNYRLGNDILLVKGSQELEYDEVLVDNLNKNKLTMSMINVPLMLEFQTRSHSEFTKFHLAAGFNLGIRIGSHTKQVYDVNGKKDKVKSHEDFYLNPFRYDLQARMGWGKLNFFATYSLNSLFRENKGPELHPFSIGLRIVNFN
jgi:hypothetical protein